MIPHNRPTLGTEEAAAAARVLASGWVAPGPEVAAFEAELATYFGLEARQVVVVSSGTAALFLALRMLGAPGDRVAMPVYACTALADAARLAGQAPVFVDSLPECPAMDPASVPDAALHVHVATFGLPARLPARAREKIVLDLAQGLGCRHEGYRLPPGVACATLSFAATKLITAGGQGGAVVSRDGRLIEAIRDFIAYDDRRDGKARFNFGSNDVAAAIGRVQLSRIERFMAMREERFDLYRAAGLDLVDLAGPPDCAVRYRAVVRTARAGEVIAALAASGVRAIVPIETAEFPAEPALFPHARALAQTTLSLPLYPTLALEEVRAIARIAEARP